MQMHVRLWETTQTNLSQNGYRQIIVNRNLVQKLRHGIASNGTARNCPEIGLEEGSQGGSRSPDTPGLGGVACHFNPSLTHFEVRASGWAREAAAPNGALAWLRFLLRSF
jgi:hypothetical protein